MSSPGVYRGAYKTPGGKLVAVRFAVVDGRLADVDVHGDFFLYPEEALTAIRASLEGAPAASPADAVQQRIAAAIPEGTEWLGASPAALATAVRRALEQGPADDDA